ncbi:uncharacterized protein RHOBADRAFT_53936 [Rhodotorula graminis WP1]|uniref:Proteophosphoglycan ppg4 n=1 Tax=Rhodotorula graminis (strain WP1) TaxID=578459 RepID=A0A194S3D3_RHOGW|nr:uncharacterized protein RHOBADRAFT_53936 [Rhodotorula graminis WP1]KPV75034.1 hypothetical protein RHOBADRAFT_53936 [Rhodotorula graminis WP1]
MPSDSPSLPSYSRLDGSAPPSQRPYHPPHHRHHQPAKLAWHAQALSLLRRPAVLLPTVAFCLVLALVSHHAPSPTPDSLDLDPAQTGYKDRLHDSFDRLASSWRTAATRPQSEADREWTCNPFEANGRLHVDLADPRKTVWTPFDSRCAPSNLLAALYRPPGDLEPLIPPHALDGGDRDAKTASKSGREFLPWFRNRTVVLQGDSIDRFHLKDFCEFVGGRLELVTVDHPACPPPYLVADADSERREWEQKWANRPDDGQALTQPWVCDIEEYGTTIVNVFTWGLEGAEDFFRTERWYYPPSRWIDRTEAVTVPLLPLLAKHLDRPQIEHPDMIVVNSGYWDLRKYTEEDFVAAGFLTRPYPEDSPIPYTPLTAEREQTWEREARKALKHVARTFPGKEGKARNGPTLLWRSLHHPPRHNYAPFPRVFQLDSLARKVLSDLRASQDPPSTAPSFRNPSSSSSSSSAAPPLSPLTDEAPESEDLGLAHRLRIDDSGRIMLGQEHLFRDLLHPLPVPGSWVWGNVMLYELKRAVEGVDR